jgi:hypothetical protein
VCGEPHGVASPSHRNVERPRCGTKRREQRSRPGRDER